MGQVWHLTVRTYNQVDEAEGITGNTTTQASPLYIIVSVTSRTLARLPRSLISIIKFMTLSCSTTAATTTTTTYALKLTSMLCYCHEERKRDGERIVQGFIVCSFLTH